MEWQPIETAPKDGTSFLGWSKTRGAHECRVHEDVRHYKRCYASIAGGGWFYPTHWMPLPESPQAEGGVDGLAAVKVKET